MENSQTFQFNAYKEKGTKEYNDLYEIVASIHTISIEKETHLDSNNKLYEIMIKIKAHDISSALNIAFNLGSHLTKC